MIKHIEVINISKIEINISLKLENIIKMKHKKRDLNIRCQCYQAANSFFLEKETEKASFLERTS
jgi:hypothetical protein